MAHSSSAYGSFNSKMKKIHVLLAHVFVWGFTAYFLLTVFDYTAYVTYHAILMFLAFIFFMTEGIITSRYIKSKQREQMLQRHLLLQLAVQVCCAVGYVYIFLSKRAKGSNHFTSWHSYIGLFAMICTFAQIFIGLLIHFYASNIRKSYGLQTYLSLLKIHSLYGNALHCICLTAIAFGFRSSYAILFFGDTGAWILVLLCIPIAFIAFVVKPKVAVRRATQAGTTPEEPDTPEAPAESTTSKEPVAP